MSVPRGLDVSTLNLRLASLRKYYAFLVEAGELEVNPAAGLYVRGKVRRVIREPLAPAELEALYQANSRRAKAAGARPLDIRNTVLLGLMVYQGLHSGNWADWKSAISAWTRARSISPVLPAAIPAS